MDNTIQYIRGDTHVISLSVTDAAGTPYVPRETDLLTMTVRVDDYRGNIVIQKKSGGGDVTATASGWEIRLLPADTATLLYKTYVYDIELDMQGVIQTVVPLSRFVLDKEVTY